MTAIAACRTCGTEPLEHARFCDGCGLPVKDSETRAEYKQVTVLFADVVHSMNIAATVGAERLREIMAELVNITAAVVQRCGGARSLQRPNCQQDLGTVGPNDGTAYTICTNLGWVDVSRPRCTDFPAWFDCAGNPKTFQSGILTTNEIRDLDRRLSGHHQNC